MEPVYYGTHNSMWLYIFERKVSSSVTKSHIIIIVIITIIVIIIIREEKNENPSIS